MGGPSHTRCTHPGLLLTRSPGTGQSVSAGCPGLGGWSWQAQEAANSCGATVVAGWAKGRPRPWATLQPRAHRDSVSTPAHTPSKCRRPPTVALIDFKRREGGRRRNAHLFHILVRTFLDPRMCCEEESNPQPRCTGKKLYPTDLPMVPKGSWVSRTGARTIPRKRAWVPSRACLSWATPKACRKYTLSPVLRRTRPLPCQAPHMCPALRPGSDAHSEAPEGYIKRVLFVGTGL